MRFIIIPIAMFLIPLLAGEAGAQSPRERFAVPTPAGEVLVESFGTCAAPGCPAVLILSGSRGFAAAAYDEIGRDFRAAGLSAYLVHALSATDLDAISKAGGAKARIAYHARRLPQWISAVRGVAAHLGHHHGGRVGILGISLGAQIASAASTGRTGIDALVLVDGGFPPGHSQPARPLPPLLLIWGSADETFPPAIGRELQRTAQRLGGPATLDIYEGGTHDFFLRQGNRNAMAARRSAADFLALHLSR